MRFRNIVALLSLGLTALFLRGCVVRPASDSPGSHFNRGKNAVWLGIEWVNSPHSQQEIAQLAADLTRRQIAYVFVYVSYMRPHGEFGATYAHAGTFVQALKQAQPSLKVLAWYGLPLHVVNHADPAIRQKVVRFSVEMVQQYGFDGIHSDPEPIGDGDPNVLALLDETRQALPALGQNGQKPILSIASHKAWPVFPDAGLSQRLGPILWSGDYYRAVARRVDQIAVMVYDSGLRDARLYRLLTRIQVIQISRALKDSRFELLIGVPTSEEDTPSHYPPAESMQAGLQGVIDGLNDHESIPDAVTGVAIYPYWETDAAEWTIYESQWLGK